MGSAYDANQRHWLGPSGRKHENLRALFPMYETSFQVAALRKSAINSLARPRWQKRSASVPPKVQPSCFFRAAGRDRAHHADHCQRRSGRAGQTRDQWRDRTPCGRAPLVPIPSLNEVTNQADAVIFRASPMPKSPRCCADVPAAFGNDRSTRKLQGPAGHHQKCFGVEFSWSRTRIFPVDTAYAITRAVLSAAESEIADLSDGAGTTRRQRAHQTGSCRSIRVHCAFYAETGHQAPVAMMPK